MAKFSLLSLFAFLGLVVACQPIHRTPEIDAPIAPPKTEKPKIEALDYTLSVSDDELKVMAYNVENLFDAQHDEKHDDWTYLPVNSPLKSNCSSMSGGYKKECYETDWTDAVVDLKIDQLAKVVEAQGSLPDLLGIEEIENENVLARLGRRLGYSTWFITKGSDGRGINNAVLVNTDKLRPLEVQSVVINTGGKGTRDILAGVFEVVGRDAIVGFYVNHWPSQANDPSERVAAGKTLQMQIEADTAKYGAQRFHPIAVGDFNTIPADHPHPFFNSILNPNSQSKMVAVNDLYENVNEKSVAVYKRSMPSGTYYYNFSFQMLDYIFVGQSLFDQAGIDVLPATFRVVAPLFSSSVAEIKFDGGKAAKYARPFLVPMSFEFNSEKGAKLGASDHFPVVVKLKL